ncbi:MAG: hypothetical protein AAGJ35_07310, partial [Myxococcota bacterium]
MSKNRRKRRHKKRKLQEQSQGAVQVGVDAEKSLPEAPSEVSLLDVPSEKSLPEAPSEKSPPEVPSEAFLPGAPSDGPWWSTHGIVGLSQKEVDAATREGKSNRVEKETSRTIQGIVLGNTLNVFNLIVFLIASVLVGLYFWFGDRRTLTDSFAICTVALVNSVMAIVQEIRAKWALDKIIALSRSTSSVIRAGKRQEVPMEALVEGDVVLLRRGDQVPVDGTILASHYCEVNESLLTGESDTIFKDQSDEVRSGSFCVAGQALCVA